MKKTILFIARILLCPFSSLTKWITDTKKSHKQHPEHLRITPKLILLLLAFSLSTSAQSNQDGEFNALKYGQLVPKTFWTTKHKVYRNGKITEEDLSSLKGKIILIDFWAAWCSSCLYALPNTNSIAEKHKDIANVILVNSSKDTPVQINNAYKLLNSNSKVFSMPSIVQDTIIKKLFPISMLPQYIWIDRDGRFMGLTGSSFVNSAPFLSMHEKDLRLDSIRKKRKEGKE